MIRPSVIKLVIALSVLCGVLLCTKLTKNSTPDSLAPSLTEESHPASLPVAETYPGLVAQPAMPTSQARSLFYAATGNWQERLASIQADTNGIFGPDAELRIKELQDFVKSIDPADLPNALKQLQDLQMHGTTAVGNDLEMRLLRRWTENDPHVAADWATQMPAMVKADALTVAASSWAEKDYAAAADWAGKLADNDERQSALKSIASGVVYTAPVDALKLACTLPDSAARNDVITRAAGTWTAQAPADAIAWAGQIPDAGLRSEVTSAIAISWGNHDPQSAAQLALDSLPGGKLQDNTVAAIASRWGLMDASAAQSWIKQLGDDNLRQIADQALKQAIERSQFH